MLTVLASFWHPLGVLGASSEHFWSLVGVLGVFRSLLGRSLGGFWCSWEVWAGVLEGPGGALEGLRRPWTQKVKKHPLFNVHFGTPNGTRNH